MREFEVGPKGKVVPDAPNYHPAKLGEFWTSGRSHF
jgi:hypothetical protein